MINNKIESFCAIAIGIISLIILSSNVLYSADIINMTPSVCPPNTTYDSDRKICLPNFYEGVPVSIGAITSSGGALGTSWTYISILMKKENDRYELIPISIKTNDPDVAARVIALMSGASKIEQPAKVYFEFSSDGNTKIKAVEAKGIMINIP
jgi:hypothetical protein